MNTTRWTSRGSAAAVAGIAAVASYSHMRALALDHGQDRLLASLLPISVDGLVVVATMALLDGRRRWVAGTALAVGVVASVVANVLAAEPTLIGRCISAWPAVALFGVVEILARPGKSERPVRTSDAAEDPKLGSNAAEVRKALAEPHPVAAVHALTTVAPVSPAPAGARHVGRKVRTSPLTGKPF